MKLFIAIGITAAICFQNLYCDQLSKNITPIWNRHSLESPPLQPEIKKWGFFADVLFWCPQETCTDWGFLVSPKLVIPPPAPSTKGHFDTFLIALNFDWNWGIRTGFGYNMEHDSWDTRLLYTWFHSQGKDHRTAPADFVIQSQFFGSDHLLHYPTFQESKILWTFLFNMFDWDLGRNCSLSDSLLFRHYLGIKGGWIHQDIYATWTNSAFQAKETLQHNFWGVGPKGGLYGRWDLAKIRSSLFSLVGDFAGAFLWGHWELCEEALHDTRGVSTYNIFPARDLGSLMFQTFTGLEWNLRTNRLCFSLQLGYEMQIWLEHLQFFQHFSGVLHNALILQGGTFKWQFTF